MSRNLRNNYVFRFITRAFTTVLVNFFTLKYPDIDTVHNSSLVVVFGLEGFFVRVLTAVAGQNLVFILRIEEAPELTQDHSWATKKEIKKVLKFT